MLIKITTTHQPASDLGFLLHKHPERFQSFELSFGKAFVFYPEVSEDRCTACLLLDVDAVDLVRGKRRGQHLLLSNYVNDRPYVASFLVSVALSKVFRSAMQGLSKERPDLADTAIPLIAQIDVLPVRGGEEFLRDIFEPLGYKVTARSQVIDEKFPEWGESHYYRVTLEQEITLKELLRHLYVLIPVFDNVKHYYIGEDEIEKLLSKGEGWLASHPLKEQITKRYLKYQSGLARRALESLRDESDLPLEEEEGKQDKQEEQLERPLSLNEQRHATVISVLRATGAKRVLDLGCGEGKLLRELLKEKTFSEIVGMDVSVRTLEIAHKRLKIDWISGSQDKRLQLLHGSLMYRDQRLSGFDAAAVVEVIEHLDPPRLTAFEKVLFRHTRPQYIVLTTPNKEYNVMWETLPTDQFRHADHRFEWTRDEFQSWSNRVAEEHGYQVRFLPVGEEDKEVGAPTQMGVFERV